MNLIEARGEGLILVNVAGIRIDKDTPPFTPEQLQELVAQRQRLGRARLSTGVDNDTVLRHLLCTRTPLVIIGDQNEPPLLSIQLRRFPHEPKNPWSYESYSIRCIPESGQITTVILVPGKTEINHKESAAEFIALNLGNGSLRLKVYYKPQILDNLLPLEPPTFRNSLHKDLPLRHVAAN